MKNETRLFKSLADETRLKILWLLKGQEELCVCDIMRVLSITQSKASRHLRYLYHLGLVNDRREGLWRYYSLSAAPGSQGDNCSRCWMTCWRRRPRRRPCKSGSASGWRKKRGSDICRAIACRFGMENAFMVVCSA